MKLCMLLTLILMTVSCGKKVEKKPSRLEETTDPYTGERMVPVEMRAEVYVNETNRSIHVHKTEIQTVAGRTFSCPLPDAVGMVYRYQLTDRSLHLYDHRRVNVFDRISGGRESIFGQWRRIFYQGHQRIVDTLTLVDHRTMIHHRACSRAY